jgi:hypothetical protein
MIPISLVFWIINSLNISSFLIAPHIGLTVLMVFFFQTVNYEIFLHKAELFIT